MSNEQQLDRELENLIAEMERALNEYEKDLQHLNDLNNPHGVSKYDLGLSNILNMGLATAGEVNALVDNKYHPLGGTNLVLQRVAITPLLNHIANKNNPHGITLDQMDMYSEAQIKERFSSKLLKTEGAYDSAAINNISRTSLHNATRVNFTNANIAEGTIHRQRFGRDLTVSDMDNYGKVTDQLTPSAMINGFLRVSGNNEWNRANVPSDNHAINWTLAGSPVSVSLPAGSSGEHQSLITPTTHVYYSMDVTLSSPQTASDWIGIVAGYRRVSGICHQLVVRVKPRDSAGAGRVEICHVMGDRVTLIDSFDHTAGEGTANGWAGKRIRIRLDKLNNTVRLVVGNWNSAALSPGVTRSFTIPETGDLSVFNVNDPNLGYTANRFGYYTNSRARAVWSNYSLKFIDPREFVLNGTNNFIHITKNMIDHGGSTGNIHLVTGHYNDLTACWNAILNTSASMGTYIIGQYRRAFNWQHVDEKGNIRGIAQTHYMYHTVVGLRNANGTTTRIF